MPAFRGITALFLLLAAAGAADINWERARRYWSFKPLSPPSSGSIDTFLRARLAGKGLQPAPPAEKRDWLRRITFDLTGLPPTPAELQAFLADTSAQARQKVVDRLLASPHYGERWARHWLDLVRFAETNGHEFDNNKLDAWRYRDYLIRAFNQDVPYDQFVKEHIAGDLLPDPRRSLDGAYLESPLGTGVYWFGEVLNSATDSVKSRADNVDNQIDVLSKAFLGLTVACARCHDHKFDPIPASDYYALAGIMHSTALREAVIDTPERQAAIRAAAATVSAEPPRGASIQLRENEEMFEDFSSFQQWHVSGVAFGDRPVNGVASSAGPGLNALVGSLTSRVFKMPRIWVHVRLAGTLQPKGRQENTPARVTIVADDHKSQHFIPTQAGAFHWRTIRMTKEIGRACYIEIVDRDRAGHLAVDAIVFSDHEKPPEASPDSVPPQIAATEPEIPPSAWGLISRDQNPRDERIHVRGNHKNLGDEVPRRFLQIIAGQQQPRVANGSGRLMLAEWMSSPGNPLTARVMVNRIWQHHFGKGLVSTSDNFGLTGNRPTHPELLDWLAARFIQSGWSVKAMHRMMLLSDAYAMSSRADETALKSDPANTLLHHIPVRRLEAESIRDAILAVSGTLDLTLYGPSVMPHISKYQDGRGKPESGPLDANGRRSIYIQVRRNFLTPMFLAFDYPLPVSTIGARGASTVPSQALLMMNNEFVAASSRAWAAKLLRETPDPAERIERMYLAAFSRPPEDSERRELIAYIERYGPESWADVCHVLFNSAEFLYVR
jgi:hypothetical protein